MKNMVHQLSCSLKFLKKEIHYCETNILYQNIAERNSKKKNGEQIA